jgi:hypothetical protein
MDSDKKKNMLYSIRYTMPRDQIMTFVSGLHDMQMDMIEELVTRSERKGFPEAKELINHIRSL